MRISTPGWVLSAAAAIVLIGALAWRAGSGAGPTNTVQMLPAADAVWLDATVGPVTDRAGLITSDQARARAAAIWIDEPSVPDTYLQVFTDEVSARTGLTSDRPIWIVRYRVNETTSYGFPIDYAYVFVDARTGMWLVTSYPTTPHD